MIGSFNQADKADKAVVMYHVNCSDGFGAAWAFTQLAPYLIQDVELIPASYGDPIEFIIDLDEDWSKHDLWIVDFSFNKDSLIDLAQRFNQVIVIDHHKTAIEGVFELWQESLEQVTNLHIVWDLERSGAGLTWDYLANLFTPSNFKRPKLISYIEDRDIWKHELPLTKEISALIASTPKEVKSYNELSNHLQRDWTYAVITGEALLRQYNAMVEDIVKLAAPITFYDANGTAHKGLCANCTGHFASDVGTLLAELSGTFGATYYSDAESATKFSLRSIGDYDVSAICSNYGGGGHKNAAGFKLSNPNPQIPGVIVWNNPEPEKLILPQGGM